MGEIAYLRQVLTLKDEQIARLTAMVASREQAVCEAIDLVAEHKSNAVQAQYKLAKLQATIQPQPAPTSRRSFDSDLPSPSRSPAKLKPETKSWSGGDKRVPRLQNSGD